MLEIPFVVLLIVAGLCVGLINGAERLAREGSKLELLVRFLNSIKVPVGIAALVISLLNAFNIHVYDYPFLTWLIVFINAIILLDEFLIEKLRIVEGPALTALEFLKKNDFYFGLTALVIMIIKTVYLLAPMWAVIL